jgi:alpha-L-rhamnosidase
MNTKALILLNLQLIISISASCIEISQLKTESRNNPLGIDVFNPRFSWILTAEDRGQFQSAYQILVSDDQLILSNDSANIWDSRKTESSRTFEIVYDGLKLESFRRYYWKVRVWDGFGHAGNWSSTAWFETSMMQPSDWIAEWISDSKPIPENDADFYLDSPNPLLRKEFKIKKNIQSARLYIAGLGYYVASINGKRVGDQILDPAWTNYGKEIMYSIYDVTQMLAKGDNAIGIMLGNGWYNPLPIKLFTRYNLRDYLTVGKPCLKAQIRICYADGTVQTILTDDCWRTGDGPVLQNSVYLGETYDARLIQDAWDKPNFKSKKWLRAQVISGPVGNLVAQYLPPIRITKVLKPVKITEPSPGVFLFDFGQNFAGVPRLKVNGPAGTTVILRSGEDIHSDGTLNNLTVIAGQLKSFWKLNGGPGCPDDPSNIICYTLNGKGDETYTPQFTFSSFRYVEMRGFPGKPDLYSIEGLRMNSDLKETGSFSCSNEMFNQIQEMCKWTFLSNVFSIQSDCPAREKFGYGGDIVATAESFNYNFDMSSFYRKVVQDFVNDVRQKGGMPEIAPSMGISSEGIGDGNGSPGWQLAFPTLLKVLYDYYGDIQVIEKNYEVLKRQVEFMQSVTPDNIVKNDISDHESIDPKPISLSATAFYFQHVKLLAEFSVLLGKEKDANRFKLLADTIKNSFIQTFLEKGTGVFGSGTQAAQLFAFYYGLIPEGSKNEAMERLLSEINQKHNGHLSTGIFGTKFMFDVLRTENLNSVAYTVANQKTFPGWGYMLTKGATTLYESWAYPDTVASQNHPMFGSISEWFYKSLIGINATSPGFSTIEIKPQPAGDLTWAKGYYDSVVGRIESDWEIVGNRFKLKVSVPVNTKALIFIPSKNNENLLESGEPVSKRKGIESVTFGSGYFKVLAGSGNYVFESNY